MSSSIARGLNVVVGSAGSVAGGVGGIVAGGVIEYMVGVVILYVWLSFNRVSS